MKKKEAEKQRLKVTPDSTATVILTVDGNGGHRLDGHTGGRVLAGALVRGAVVARVDAKHCMEKMEKMKGN